MPEEALREGPMIPWETLKAGMDAEIEAEIEWEREMYGEQSSVCFALV
jgi:hypothetical protein